VISGIVVTMNDARDVLRGVRVFLRDAKILAVARQGAELPPVAMNAYVVTTEGFIYPGVLSTSITIPSATCSPCGVVPEHFRDRSQWRGRKAYNAAVPEPYKMLSKKEYFESPGGTRANTPNWRPSPAPPRPSRAWSK
jgi:hypothetical protein